MTPLINELSDFTPQSGSDHAFDMRDCAWQQLPVYFLIACAVYDATCTTLHSGVMSIDMLSCAINPSQGTIRVSS